jgi:ATP-dependent Lon protease
MTGEITLRGKVLPVGGIREKVLAAYRAGVKKVILPQRNRDALEDVPEEIRKTIQFTFAESAEQVIEAALVPGDVPAPSRHGDGGRPESRA